MRVLLTCIAASLALGAAPSVQADPYEEALTIVKDAKLLATKAEEAEKKFRKVCAADPNNVHAWYNLGLLARLRGDMAGAEEAWRGALRVKADYLPAKARLAQLTLERGQRTEGLRVLEQIIEENPFQAEARNLLAEAAIHSKDWDKAIQHARNVLLGDPDNTNAYLNLAVAYYRQGLVDQAWLITKNALDRRPEAAALHNMMGLIHLGKDDSRRASESFLRALEEDPNHIDAKLNLAALELSYGDFPSALKRFEEVLDKRPDDVMVMLSRGVALRGLKKYVEAETAYEAALRKKPDLPQAIYNLCVLHHQYTNKWKRAESYCARYQSSIERGHPKWREIRRRLKSIRATIEALAPEPSAPGAPGAPATPPGEGEPAGEGGG